MELRGPIPFSAAAAYGLPARPAPAASEPAAKANASAQTMTPRPVDFLVAGTIRSDVNRGVGFDGDAVSTAPASMAMYSRTAERLEAATRVALGKSLDVTG